MQKILAAESIAADLEAIDEVARAADGSMRDGLSLLDQAIAFGQGKLEAETTRSMLGTVSRENVLDVVEALAAKDAPLVLQNLDQLNTFGGNPAQILARMAESFHTLAFLQIGGTEAITTLEASARLTALTHSFDAQTLQVLFQLAILGARDVAVAPDARLAFEMCVLRMLSFNPSSSNESGSGKTSSGQQRGSGSSSLQSASAPTSAKPVEISTKPSMAQTAMQALIEPVRASVKPAADLVQAAPAATTSPVAKPVTAKTQPAPTLSAADKVVESTSDDADNWRDSMKASDAFAEQQVEPSSEPSELRPIVIPASKIPASKAVDFSEIDKLSAEQRQWLENVLALPLRGPARELACNCVLLSQSAALIEVQLDPAHAFLLNKDHEQTVQAAWQQQFPEQRWQIKIAEITATQMKPSSYAELAQAQKQQAFEALVLQHPMVLSLQRELGASIRAGSVRMH
jgi:DNA polymerase III subunit gamma/tau